MGQTLGTKPVMWCVNPILNLLSRGCKMARSFISPDHVRLSR